MPQRGRRSQRLGAYIRKLRDDRYINALAQEAEIAQSRWRQIEAGEIPPADTLWRMAHAMQVTGVELKRLFMLAGFGPMFDDIGRASSALSKRAPRRAEDGVESDPSLSRQKRAKALDYLRMLRQVK